MMTCKICNGPNKEAIDKALLLGTPFRTIAKQYGTSPAALQRHKRDHLPIALIKAKEAQELTHGDNLWNQMMNLNSKALSILSRAEKSKNDDIALKALAECRKNLELQGRLLGEFNKQTPSSSPGQHLHIHGLHVETLRGLAETGEMPVTDLTPMKTSACAREFLASEKRYESPFEAHSHFGMHFICGCFDHYAERGVAVWENHGG